MFLLYWLKLTEESGNISSQRNSQVVASLKNWSSTALETVWNTNKIKMPEKIDMLDMIVK